jgi:hypothetical protein
MRREYVVVAAAIVAICYGGLPASGAAGWARNDSMATLCAEVDNVNIPLFSGGQISSFTVRATHPQYAIYPRDYPCSPSWRDCVRSAGSSSGRERWTTLFDDGRTVLDVGYLPSWWREGDRAMTVTVGGRSMQAHCLRIYKKALAKNSWPQILVFYADGNLRLKPHAPAHMQDVCFGSSILIGPAAPGDRPFADVARVVFKPGTPTLEITFADGQTADLDVSASREETIVTVHVGYVTDASNPFAIFRSMYVEDGNCDVDSVEWAGGEESILSNWPSLEGSSWFFHRNVRSSHNTSSPDLTIRL